MIRTAIAILIAPGIAATLISAIHLAQDDSTVMLPAYYMVTYTFALFPGAILIAFLRVRGYTRFWHYVLAGCICSVAVTALFVLSAYSGASSFAVQIDRFLDLWPVMIVGPITGGLVWIVCESRWLNRVFPQAAVNEGGQNTRA